MIKKIKQFIQWFKRNKDIDLYFYYRGESKWKQR
jgi:hypothetical protein